MNAFIEAAGKTLKGVNLPKEVRDFVEETLDCYPDADDDEEPFERTRTRILDALCDGEALAYMAKKLGWPAADIPEDEDHLEEYEKADAQGREWVEQAYEFFEKVK